MTAYSSTSPPRPSRWLIRALANKRWFTDHEPNWPHLPTAQEAREERKQRIRLLRKHKHYTVADALNRCAPRARCFSGCCPVCGRAFQRFIATSAHEILDQSNDYDVASVVGRVRVPTGQLSQFDLRSYRRRLESTLSRARVGLAIGGVDFSLNEFPVSKLASRWVPHFYLLAHNSNRARWETELRRNYPCSRAVPRPIRIAPWDGNIRSCGYMLKMRFDRRIEVLAEQRNANGYRRFKDTRKDKLRSTERAEIYAYLHSIGLEARLILIDAIKKAGGFDVAAP